MSRASLTAYGYPPDKCHPSFDPILHARLRLTNLPSSLTRNRLRSYLQSIGQAANTNLFHQAIRPHESCSPVELVCFTVMRADLFKVYRAVQQGSQYSNLIKDDVLGAQAVLKECHDSYEMIIKRGTTLFAPNLPSTITNYELAQLVHDHTGVLPWAVYLRYFEDGFVFGYIAMSPHRAYYPFKLEYPAKSEEFIYVNLPYSDESRPKQQPTIFKKWVTKEAEPVAERASSVVAERAASVVVAERAASVVVAERADPVVAERAAPVVAERAAPVVAERAASVVAERAAPVVAERAASVVAEHLSPVVPKRVTQAMTEHVTPVVTGPKLSNGPDTLQEQQPGSPEPGEPDHEKPRPSAHSVAGPFGLLDVMSEMRQAAFNPEAQLREIDLELAQLTKRMQSLLEHRGIVVRMCHTGVRGMLAGEARYN